LSGLWVSSQRVNVMGYDGSKFQAIMAK